MIYVTQGHERGIGLEVFLRSLACLPCSSLGNFQLIISEKTFKLHQKWLPKNSEIKIHLLKTINVNQTMSALNAGLSLVGPKDILLTLPSSKDQFIYQNNNLAGHTEFFRNYFANPHISMLFVGEVFHLLLLTEHISISAVANFLEKDQFEMRIKLALANMPKVNKVILLGIDPHCGDKGAISHLDALWDRLSSTRWDPKVEFIGPVSADSLIQNSQLTKNALVVSAFHDQGLSLFKSLHGHMGINRTIGMPFMRLSPDHGTAFALYGKGSASIQGTLHTLLYALKNQD